MDELVGERALREPFFRTVREGDGLPLPVRTVTAGARRIGDLVDSGKLAAQHAEGATLVLQSLHRMHPPVGRFCRALAAELGHATQCNAYVTPAGDAQGFDHHHDTHDVFVLQVSGRKRWVVHEPVLPLPLPSQARSGPDLVPEGAEPLLDVELEAGDCLYLPRGYVHAALTTDEHSVHLTVGVLATTWFDVLTDAVSLAQDDVAFRDALPVAPRPGLADALPDLLRRAASLLESLDPARVAAVVDRRLAAAVPPEPVPLLAAAAAARASGPAAQVRPRLGLPVTLHGSVVRLPDREVAFPASCTEALARALAAPAAVGELALGGLDEDDAVVLARRLLREGVLLPA